MFDVITSFKQKTNGTVYTTKPVSRTRPRKAIRRVGLSNEKSLNAATQQFLEDMNNIVIEGR